jgi:hypothetical protein
MAGKLDLILAEVRKIQVQQDARFDLIKDEFSSVRAEFAAVRSEMARGFAAVRKDLTVVRNQTAHITERVATLESQRSV